MYHPSSDQYYSRATRASLSIELSDNNYDSHSPAFGMGPAIMALVGVLLQVTLVSESSDRRTAKNLNLADVDRVISSALRQLSTAVYNNLVRILASLLACHHQLLSCYPIMYISSEFHRS